MAEHRLTNKMAYGTATDRGFPAEHNLDSWKGPHNQQVVAAIDTLPLIEQTVLSFLYVEEINSADTHPGHQGGSGWGSVGGDGRGP